MALATAARDPARWIQHPAPAGIPTPQEAAGAHDAERALTQAAQAQAPSQVPEYRQPVQLDDSTKLRDALADVKPYKGRLWDMWTKYLSEEHECDEVRDIRGLTDAAFELVLHEAGTRLMLIEALRIIRRCLPPPPPRPPHPTKHRPHGAAGVSSHTSS